MHAAHIDGGFLSPVLDAQGAFHAVMHAMAEPGTIRSLEPRTAPPAPLNATAAAVALTLCDHDTPVWLDPDLANAAGVSAWLSFHSGMTITEDAAEARFLIASNPDRLPLLATLAQGSQEYPDRSATIILQVAMLEGGNQHLELRGPGIAGVAHLAPDALPQQFESQWQENNAGFPRGVDLILAAPSALACLPRTTRIKIVEG